MCRRYLCKGGVQCPISFASDVRSTCDFTRAINRIIFVSSGSRTWLERGFDSVDLFLPWSGST